MLSTQLRQGGLRKELLWALLRGLGFSLLAGLGFPRFWSRYESLPRTEKSRERTAGMLEGSPKDPRIKGLAPSPQLCWEATEPSGGRGEWKEDRYTEALEPILGPWFLLCLSFPFPAAMRRAAFPAACSPGLHCFVTSTKQL